MISYVLLEDHYFQNLYRDIKYKFLFLVVRNHRPKWEINDVCRKTIELRSFAHAGLINLMIFGRKCWVFFTWITSKVEIKKINETKEKEDTITFGMKQTIKISEQIIPIDGIQLSAMRC